MSDVSVDPRPPVSIDDAVSARRSWFKVGGALSAGALGVATIVALVVPPTLTDPSGISGGVLSNYRVAGGLHVDLQGESEVQFDKITLAPGATMGWHAHNGYELVSIASGTATFYDADDPSCTPKRFGQGEGIVEVPHHVHLTRNEGANPLVLFVASMTPTDKKTDIDEPRPGNCPF